MILSEKMRNDKQNCLAGGQTVRLHRFRRRGLGDRGERRRRVFVSWRTAACGRRSRAGWSAATRPKAPRPARPPTDPEHLRWLLDLQSQGFEIAWHGGTWHSLPRRELRAALEKFAGIFGHYPLSAANHNDDEALYWGSDRLSGFHFLLYNLLTFYRHDGKYRGHIEGDDYFWGDLCRKKIKYFRNFVFQDINTLRCCPMMPYHDTDRPYVNHWFAASDGANVQRFNRCIAERKQDQLEADGDACIMYARFANGFADRGRLEPRFEQLVRRLSQKNGWFVPVATLLDYLMSRRGRYDITPSERKRLESRWLMEKLVAGATELNHARGFCPISEGVD